MLKAIIIDDERPAIRELEYLLTSYQNIMILGKYTNPEMALKEIESKKPNVIFLDINMPQINGMDLASEITNMDPKADIIFVTAYDSYAVEAFDINATDYLLKPIKKERLEQTIKKIVAKHSIFDSGRKLIIKSFGDLRISWEDHAPIKWRTEKTKELYAFLLHNCGKSVSKYEIIDAVWPHTDPEKAEHQLHNGIYYIRRKLEEYGIPRNSILLSGNYCLTLFNVHFDRAFVDEYLYKNINSLPLNVLQRLEEEYSGSYFDQYDWPWAEYDRHIYARHHYKIAFKLSEIYFDNCEYEKAEGILEKITRINPYDEQPILLLSRIFLAFNRKIEALKLLKDFYTNLKEDLDILPSDDFMNIYSELC